MSPVVALICGMAGAGKTTLLQRLNGYMHEKSIPSYLVNLDPAVLKVPFTPNIDIRDTVDYKAVMKDYHLGPNGAIMTSLNLFATKFDQVLSILEQRTASTDHVFIDTPGQIEMMTWSASGSIITGALASSLPTCILFVVDTPRSLSSPGSFVSNMLYACSIAYNTRLPLILVWTKSDAGSPAVLDEWMRDIDSLQSAVEQDESYLSTFTRSLALVIEEFYSTLQSVSVSAYTGEGIDNLLAAIKNAGKEWEDEYKPMYDEVMSKRGEEKVSEQEAEIAKFKLEMENLEKGLD
ncbi:hypothetical protein P9112_008820 [Eukaryota sp. TZLM1-RC]